MSCVPESKGEAFLHFDTNRNKRNKLNSLSSLEPAEPEKRGRGGARTHHCAPRRAGVGRAGSAAASLVSSATCWLHIGGRTTPEDESKSCSKNYVNRAHPPRMCPVMIINNALRLITGGGGASLKGDWHLASPPPIQMKSL